MMQYIRFCSVVMASAPKDAGSALGFGPLNKLLIEESNCTVSDLLRHC